MFTLLGRKLKSQKGAMDKIIVTFLLVMMGVGGAAGLNTWMTQKVKDVKDKANTKINTVIKEETTTSENTSEKKK